MKIRTSSEFRKIIKQAVNTGSVTQEHPELSRVPEMGSYDYLYISTLKREETEVLLKLWADKDNQKDLVGYSLKEEEHTQIERYLKFLLSLPDNAQNFPTVSQLHAIPPMLQKLVKTLERGWVYRLENGIPLPYLIAGAEHYPYDQREKTEAHTEIYFAARGNRTGGRLSISNNDLRASDTKRTLIQILASAGCILENAEYNAQYDAHLERYEQQIRHDHTLFDLRDNAVGHEDSYRTSAGQIRGQFILDLSKAGSDTGRGGEKPPAYSFWPEEQRPKVPLHPYLYGFLLRTHTHGRILSQHVEKHQYVKMAHQIVLKRIQRRLIDILTANLEILGDVIEGKNEGTTIIAIGPPGLGKTLTAEIYSEETGRPLYKVHSGQLGKSGEKIEQSLKTIFDNANRWNAVLLIDEADTYIRERGDDIEQNTIVAAFLRAMEYFNGLLFMTSNRQDIDDAILSRASAIIVYDTPRIKERESLWRLHAKNLNIELGEALIKELAATFDTSGRDVLNLLKLAKRYSDGTGTPLDIHAFRDCAPFKQSKKLKPPATPPQQRRNTTAKPSKVKKPA